MPFSKRPIAALALLAALALSVLDATAHDESKYPGLVGAMATAARARDPMGPGQEGGAGAGGAAQA